MMLNLVKPKYFIPQTRKVQAIGYKNAKLAGEVGMPGSSVIIAQNGDVLEIE